MHLLSIDSTDEFNYLNRLYLNNPSIFEEHTHIGGTNMGKDWYWIHSGESMGSDSFTWCAGCPNGQNELDEHCIDIMIENGQITMDDVACHDPQVLFKFVCEKADQKRKN